jgi:predicted RNase H-like HicB family nuclease
LRATEIKYGVILQWSAEDETFIAEVPELSGCAADGETYQEALSNVEVIIEEWIETAQRMIGCNTSSIIRSMNRFSWMGAFADGPGLRKQTIVVCA